MNTVWFAFGLTLLAGMATAIGSVIAFTVKRTNYRFLSVSTGFSAGVMLYVAFVEIFFKGHEALVPRFGDVGAHWINTASFFGGILLIGLIDFLIPSEENPHVVHSDDKMRTLQNDPCLKICDPDFLAEESSSEPSPLENPAENKKLMRMGLFTALAIAIHNFPEGLATFLAALKDPKLGVAIAIAIALHNIPEGISVSVPIFYATGSRKKAFFYSALSGLAEPIGAAVGYFIILAFFGSKDGVIPTEIMGILFGFVAGIMVYISLDELLPTSQAYGKGHDSLLGLIAGMLVMALSLLLML